MTIIKWLKEKLRVSEETRYQKNEHPKLKRESYGGLVLKTFDRVIESPTDVQISDALEKAINAFDEFVLLTDDYLKQSSSSIYGIGFGDSYRLEYKYGQLSKTNAYVKEGVSMDEAKQCFLMFKKSHQIMLDGSWQLQKID